jgi:hypothetical protein
MALLHNIFRSNTMRRAGDGTAEASFGVRHMNVDLSYPAIADVVRPWCVTRGRLGVRCKSARFRGAGIDSGMVRFQGWVIVPT